MNYASFFSQHSPSTVSSSRRSQENICCHVSVLPSMCFTFRVCMAHASARISWYVCHSPSLDSTQRKSARLVMTYDQDNVNNYAICWKIEGKNHGAAWSVRYLFYGIRWLRDENFDDTPAWLLSPAFHASQAGTLVFVQLCRIYRMETWKKALEGGTKIRPHSFRSIRNSKPYTNNSHSSKEVILQDASLQDNTCLVNGAKGLQNGRSHNTIVSNNMHR
jgi:hypothetical protein